MKVTKMLLDEPHIERAALEAITAPTLVLASDHDLIRDEHTLEIYLHVSDSQLCLFPNATHMVPFVTRRTSTRRLPVFSGGAVREKDRVEDTMKSYEKQKASLQ